MKRRAFITLVGGAAVGWSPAARTQSPAKVHRLAILVPISANDAATGKRLRIWTAFFDELHRQGYDEGRNLAVDWRSSAGDAMHAAALARDVAALKPDLIFTSDSQMVRSLKAAVTAIPVVAVTGDPVAEGIAASLSRPGGNITGFSITASREIVAKRIELLKEAVPKAAKTAWLVPRRAWIGTWRALLDETAQVTRYTMVEAVLEAPVDEAEYRRAFAAMVRENVDSLYVTPALENLEHRRLIADLAARSRLPAVYSNRENVEAGGLMAYGVDLADLFRRSAGYIDRIFKGADPAAMPFQQPTRFELAINLSAAKALGLTIPGSLLARADEVIE